MEWTYTKDASGDWRGVSNDGKYRTRLKGSLVWAKRDVNINRLQCRRGDVWVDEIDGKQHRYTMPGEPSATEEQPQPRKGEYQVPADATIDYCHSCDAEIVWIRTPKGKAMPLSVATIERRDGERWALSHFADCQHGREWKRR